MARQVLVLAHQPSDQKQVHTSPYRFERRSVKAAWRRQWQQVVPFFAFPPEVRRIIYTTNAIESLSSKLRSSVRGRGHFPSDEAATKLLYMVLRDVAKNWEIPQRAWTAAKTQFAILFGDRFSLT
jgi:putative transposase